MSVMARAAVGMWRVVLVGWLVGWWLKAHVWAELVRVGMTYRIRHAMFPALMQHPATLGVLMILPALTIPAAIWPTRRRLIAASALLLVCALGNLLHLLSFFDMTWATSAWVAVWMLWLAANSERADERLVPEAQLLAKTTVSMIFLGGAVGKLTPEYWDGTALYHVYFLQKPYGLYVWLRAQYAPETLRALATWFSRAVVLTEWLIALAWPLPMRWYARGVILFLILMVAGSTPWLASVLLCLAALLFATTLHTPRAASEHVDEVDHVEREESTCLTGSADANDTDGADDAHSTAPDRTRR